MARPKGKQTFTQFLKTKHPKVFEEHKDKALFSLRDAISLVAEWQHERRTELRMFINEMEKED